MVRSGIFLVLVLGSSSALAQGTCPWVPTLGKSPEEVAKFVEEKSGKKPTKSCGGGTDYKVCHECATKLSPDQWRRVQWMLAEPAYRNWHRNWHQQSITDARKQAGKKRKSADELQGESFFYAHREFYRNVQANLAAMGLPCILPWAKPPSAVDDPDFPMFADTEKKEAAPACKRIDPSGEKLKLLQLSEEERIEAERPVNELSRQKFAEVQKIKSPVARMKASEKVAKEMDEARNQIAAKLKNKPPELSTEEFDILSRCLDNGHVERFTRVQEQMRAHNSNDFLLKNSLGQVGDEIERTWHAPLHSFYETKQPDGCHEDSIEPACDSMQEPYSSHVNMNFFKVHGLVDEYAEKWLARHGFERTSKDCKGDKKCYQWNAAFVGKTPNFVDGSGCSMDLGPNGVVAANRTKAQPTNGIQSKTPAKATKQTR